MSFMVQQDILIRDLKPAIVKVYDYYEKGECELPEQRNPTSDHRTQECVG